MATVEMSSNVLAELDLCNDALTAVTGQLVTCTLHLGKTSMLVDRNTPIATLAAQEADFDGYAAKAVTWGTPSKDSAGRAGLPGTAPEHRPSGSTTPNTCFNAWIQNGAGLLIDAWVINGVVGIPMGATTNFYLALPFYRPTLNGTVEQSW